MQPRHGPMFDSCVGGCVVEMTVMVAYYELATTVPLGAEAPSVKIVEIL